MSKAKIEFIKKFCLREVARLAELANVRANEAVGRLAERWEATGERPITDAMATSARRGNGGSRKLGTLKPKIKEALNNINKNAWKKVRFCLDSGAGETVMAEDDLP